MNGTSCPLNLWYLISIPSWSCANTAEYGWYEQMTEFLMQSSDVICVNMSWILTTRSLKYKLVTSGKVVGKIKSLMLNLYSKQQFCDVAVGNKIGFEPVRILSYKLSPLQVLSCVTHCVLKVCGTPKFLSLSEVANEPLYMKSYLMSSSVDILAILVVPLHSNTETLVFHKP